MKLSKLLFPALALVSSTAGAVGIGAPDFSAWARNTLEKEHIADARVVETKYPFSFTFCRKGSSTLWQYEAMSAAEIKALSQGKTTTSVRQQQNPIQVEANSTACGAGV